MATRRSPTGFREGPRCPAGTINMEGFGCRHPKWVPDRPVGPMAGSEGRNLATTAKFFGIDTLIGGAIKIGKKLFEGDDTPTAPALPQGFNFGQTRCPEGTIQAGNSCIDPIAALPGGKPLVSRAGMTPVAGAFDLPAFTPRVVQRTVRECGPGLVLGTDDLCYPRAVLGRRNRFRKWKGAPRPTLSAADERAIRRASAAKKRVLGLAKEAGLHASMTKPRPKTSPPVHGGVLKVIAEETN